jgi:hypothetical protein
MDGSDKVLQGTEEWFEMVGELMCEAAAGSELSPALNLSFVERYTDGAEISEGRVQGIRFDIHSGKPTFRVGVQRHEQADIIVEITAAAARTLNGLRSADPAYPTAHERYLATGEMRVEGNPASLGAWLENVHDPIVDRTRLS